MSDAEMVKVYRITMNGQTLVQDNLNCIEDMLEGSEPDDEYILTVGEMPRAEYEALEEFNGW